MFESSVDIIKSILIGVCAAFPFGPVLVMVVQKTLVHGRKTGFISSMGSTVVDTLYATVCLLALGLASDFLNAHKTAILIIGGCAVIVVGIMILRNKVRRKPLQAKAVAPATRVGNAVQTALCAFSNPGALLMVAGLLTIFRMDAETISIHVWTFSICVATGACTYWLVLTWILAKYGKFKLETLQKINNYAGWIMIAFGILLVIKGVMELIYV